MFSCLLMLIHNHKTALIPSQEKTAFPSKKKKKKEKTALIISPQNKRAKAKQPIKKIKNKLQYFHNKS